jgi:hypothetical protein
MLTKQQVIKELKQISGVGISIATDLWNIGITSVNDLKEKVPKLLYCQSNKFADCTQDRCLLYVFKFAVYYSEIPMKMQEPKEIEMAELET